MKVWLPLLLLLITFNLFGQVCPHDNKGSINAFYDAKVLSSFYNNPTYCGSKETLNILLAYSKQSNYSFKSKVLSEMYNKAIERVFSIDSIKNYFKTARADSKTLQLKSLIDQYNNLLREDSIYHSRRFRLDTLSSETILKGTNLTDSFQVKDDLSEILTLNLVDFVSLKNRLNNYLQTKDSVNRTSIIITINNFKTEILNGYDTTIASVEKSLNKKTAEVFDAFIKLDKKIQATIINKGIYETEDFIKQYLEPSSLQSFQAGATDSFYYRNETFSLTNFKMPSQTEVIDALAIYLARRFKQEVALTLVDQFRKILKNEDLISDLFPETLKMFTSGEVYEMPSFGSAWNYAISKDFTNMLPNLARSDYLKKRIGDTNMVSHLQNVIELSSLINKQYSYVDAVSLLYNKRLPSSFFNTAVTTMYIINKELFDTLQNTRFWINAEQLYALNEDQGKMFYELIKEKYDNDIGAFSNLDWANKEQINRTRNMLSSTLVILNNFQNERRKFLTMQNSIQNLQTTDYWSFLNLIFETINLPNEEGDHSQFARFQRVSNYCFETYSLLTQRNYAGAALKIIDLLPELKDNNYIDIESILVKADHYSKLVKNYKQNKEGLKEKLDDLSRLLKVYLMEKKLLEEIKEAKADFRYLTNDPRIHYLIQNQVIKKQDVSIREVLLNAIPLHLNEIKARKIAILNELEPTGTIDKSRLSHIIEVLENDYDNDELKKYISEGYSKQFASFRKLTNFLSDLLIANSSQNISLVIEKYALPPNSYKIKRTTRRSWDLNAYVGGFLGAEFISVNSKLQSAPVYGFSAPIGISYSWGKTIPVANSVIAKITGQDYRSLKGNANSITFSLVDIGAVVAYRITNDASKGLPQQVKWSQFISPGLHMRYGIKDTPLCFSFGLQSTPQLRKLNNNDDPISTIRTYAGLFFDLPLYHISHK